MPYLQKKSKVVDASKRWHASIPFPLVRSFDKSSRFFSNPSFVAIFRSAHYFSARRVLRFSTSFFYLKAPRFTEPGVERWSNLWSTLSVPSSRRSRDLLKSSTVYPKVVLQLSKSRRTVVLRFSDCEPFFLLAAEVTRVFI
jgi:hypothetical protein